MAQRVRFFLSVDFALATLLMALAGYMRFARLELAAFNFSRSPRPRTGGGHFGEGPIYDKRSTFLRRNCEFGGLSLSVDDSVAIQLKPSLGNRFHRSSQHIGGGWVLCLGATLVWPGPCGNRDLSLCHESVGDKLFAQDLGPECPVSIHSCDTVLSVPVSKGSAPLVGCCQHAHMGNRDPSPLFCLGALSRCGHRAHYRDQP